MASPTDKNLSKFEGGAGFDSHAEADPNVNQDPGGDGDVYDPSEPYVND